MNSVLLNTATRVLVALMLLFSVYMLLRGHNEPGGGFIGGLIAAVGFALYAMAHGTAAARRALRLDPRSIAVLGLAVAGVSGFGAVLAGAPFMTGQWWFLGGDAGGGSKGLALSTVLVFDVGVYLVVVGSVLSMVLALEETT